MVPLEAAGISSGAAAASAPSTTSVTRWEVSTLPAAIAAGASALTTVPSGAITRMGRRMPGGERNVFLNQAAEHVHHRRQSHRVVGVHRTLQPAASEPEKSTVAESPRMVIATLIHTGLGASLTPSLSRQSSKRYTPPASLRMAARIMRSL